MIQDLYRGGRIIRAQQAVRISGVTTFPIAYQLEMDLPVDIVEFSPGLWIDKGASPQILINSNIGVRFFAGKFVSQGWHISGYTEQPNLFEWAGIGADSYSIPWNKSFNMLIEFFSPSSYTNASIEFNLLPIGLR